MTEQLVFIVRLLSATAFAVFAILAYIRDDTLTALVALLVGGAFLFLSFQGLDETGWPSLVTLVFLSRIIYLHGRKA